MSEKRRFNRNRRDLNVNSGAIASMNVDPVRTQRGHAGYIGRTMFDFKVGDEVEVNMNLAYRPDFFSGTILTREGNHIRVAPDMTDPYRFEYVDKCVMRPVVKP